MSRMVKVSSKGQITLPASIRKKINVKPGEYVRLVEDSDGGVRILVAENGIEYLKGSVCVSSPQDIEQARRKALQERIDEKNN
ncbi:transcriptional regulator, AbrB family [Dethiobacter alkaliphilus AHT 1]|uniref:Transcriptional regulator, AbrB family n=2 Tax=Dethiobacter TaxID=427925 RepID=C0GDU6_DETAL|nr:transcriptional regulator, AbrB family [Dethiobacter alkaliphilus AHT 1]